MTAGPDEGQKIAGVDAIIGSVWAVMMQPLLFGCAGASVSAANMPDNSLAKALLLVFSGMFPNPSAVASFIFKLMRHCQTRCLYPAVAISCSAIPVCRVAHNNLLCVTLHLHILLNAYGTHGLHCLNWYCHSAIAACNCSMKLVLCMYLHSTSFMLKAMTDMYCFAGLAVRIPVALLSLLRGPFSWRESIFLALSWVAKVSLLQFFSLQFNISQLSAQFTAGRSCKL